MRKRDFDPARFLELAAELAAAGEQLRDAMIFAARAAADFNRVVEQAKRNEAHARLMRRP